MKVFFYTMIALLSVQSLAAQDAWLTDIDEGISFAKSQNTLLLVEIGSVEDGEAIFIANEVWNDSLVEAQLVNYIPVSVELQPDGKFFKRHQISFSPTILIMDRSNNVLFKDPGYKTAAELAQILQTIHLHSRKLNRLLEAYKRETTAIGRLQKAEEYLYLSFLSPNDMKMYFYRNSRSETVLFDGEFSDTNKELKDRYKIIKYGQELNAGDFYKGIAGLERFYGKKLSTADKALCLFYLSLAEYIDENESSSLNYRVKLALMSKTNALARDYSEKLTQLLGVVDPE